MMRDTSRVVMFFMRSIFSAGVNTSQGSEFSLLRAADSVVVAVTISSRRTVDVATSISDALT